MAAPALSLTLLPSLPLPLPLPLPSNSPSLASAKQLHARALRHATTVSFNHAIRAYTSLSLHHHSLKLYLSMLHFHLIPNQYTFPFLINSCLSLHLLSMGRQLHASLLKLGLFPSNHFCASAILDLYLNLASFHHALLVFDRIPHRKFIKWNPMIKACTQNGYLHKGFILQLHFKLDFIILNKNPNSRSFCSSLMYFFSQSFLLGLELIDEMTSEGFRPEISTWNDVICSCVDRREINLALDVLREMTSKAKGGVKPNHATFYTLLAILPSISSGNKIKELHGFILRNLELIGLGPVVLDRVISSLASGYAHNKLVKYAHRLFHQVRLKINLLFNSIIEAFLYSGQDKKAFEIFSEMAFQFGYDARPISNFSLTLILPKCAQISKWGLEIHAYAYRNNLDQDTSVCNALMAMYAKRGDITAASRIFQGNNFDKDRVSWNTIISIYTLICDFSTAFKLFDEMTSYKVRPDEYTFGCLLNCCGFCSYLKQAMASHAQILKRGLYEAYPAVQNALMDTYGNCGCIEDAQKVFDEIGSKDMISWNTIISSYRFSTDPGKSFTLFHTMQERGYRPNRITFTALLSACSHMGLVKDALYYFESMSTKYGITPDLGHYCCVVDCLARVGELYRALEFINVMPIEPDAHCWSALLNGCRIHGQLELAEIVTEKLFDLDPNHSGYWVLLSNTYADASRWRDKEQLRVTMKEKGVKKMPGLSWVETSTGELHRFFNGDKLHAQCDDIYSTLDGLMEHLRDEDYSISALDGPLFSL